jgi:hypothetical protein
MVAADISLLFGDDNDRSEYNNNPFIGFFKIYYGYYYLLFKGR